MIIIQSQLFLLAPIIEEKAKKGALFANER